jgi:hypothetical protein
MQRPAPRTARSIAAVALTAAWLVFVIGSGGCEVAVGDTVPAFACEPGSGDTCPAGQTCDSNNHCVPCSTPDCTPPVVDSGMPMEVSVQDTGSPPPDTSMPDTGTVMDTSTPPIDTGTVEAGCGGAIGCSCGSNASCTSDVCATQAAVVNATLSTNAGGAFCSQGCCTSADCPTGWVCYATSAGGNYCVQPAWVGRTQGMGTALPGATCGTGRDCRSGLCEGSTCIDTCCSGDATGECTGSTVCTFSTFQGVSPDDKNFAASCGMASGTGTNGHMCSANTACESGICGADSMFGNNYCHDACRSATDCTGTCDGSPCACTYVLPNGATGGLVAVCAGSTGNTPEGQPCSTSNDTCATGFCDPVTNECTSVCFTDSDCTTDGWKCRPVLVTLSSGGSVTALACGT